MADPKIAVCRTRDLDDRLRSAVVRLCIDAHHEPDFEHLFSYLPPNGVHVLASLEGRLVGHAVVTTRWLQPDGGARLRTAYVDAVSTSPDHQRRGIGGAVMRQVAAAAVDWEIGGLQTDRPPFYERLGWEQWRGPLAGRTDAGLVPTPDVSGVMILRLPGTPDVDLDALLTIEEQPGRIW